MKPSSTKDKPRFVVYVGPADAEVDLEPMKIYRVAHSEPGDPTDYLRVIDESGESYLYPQSQFEPITVSQRVEAALKAG
ncbi:MAG: hypothetical protein IT445_18645 [Phycisphaeraceae bacterium]|nr:hypothetical protein [Phycisphaeraceae bacterium]